MDEYINADSLLETAFNEQDSRMDDCNDVLLYCVDPFVFWSFLPHRVLNVQIGQDAFFVNKILIYTAV